MLADGRKLPMHLGLGGGVFWAEVTIPGGGRKGGRCGKTGVGLGVGGDK